MSVFCPTQVHIIFLSNSRKDVHLPKYVLYYRKENIHIESIYGNTARRSRRRTIVSPYFHQPKLQALGWQRGQPVSSFAKGKMLTKGTYRNLNGHLPQIPGRIWYEADINYRSGKRNSQRILWSNDGLIFVTYDHYATFYEII